MPFYTFTVSGAPTATANSTGIGNAVSNSDIVQVQNTGGALPAPLAPSTNYYIVSIATNTFGLSLTPGGTAITFTTNGSGTNQVVDSWLGHFDSPHGLSNTDVNAMLDQDHIWKGPVNANTQVLANLGGLSYSAASGLFVLTATGQYLPATSFLNALTLVTAAGGGIIYLPIGTTPFTSVSPSVPIIIQGQGDASILQLSAGSVAGSHIAPSAGAIFRDFCYDGNRANNPTTASAGFFIDGLTNRVNFQNVTIENVNATSAIIYLDSARGKVRGCRFVNNAYHGLVAQQTAYGTGTYHDFGDNDFQCSTYTVSGATNASPIVITTTAPHQALSADRITHIGILGNTAANGAAFVKVLSPITYGLYSDAGLTTPIAGSGAYTSGGVAITGAISIRLQNQGFTNVHGNSVNGGGECIGAQGCTYCSIDGNPVGNSGDSGITITGTSGSPSKGVRASGNPVNNTAIEGIYIGDYAIDTEAIDNPISGAGAWALAGRGSGIQVFGSHTTGTLVSASRITANAEYGVFVNGAVNTRVAGSLEGNTLGEINTDGTDSGTSYVPAKGGGQIEFTGQGAMSAAATLYVTVTPPGPLTNTTEGNPQLKVANRSGLARNLRIHTGTATVHNVVVTARKNFGATVLTATILAGFNVASDAVHSFAYAPGDLFSLQVVTLAGETASDLHAMFDI